ncbi:MAG: hypothetical protein FGF50_11040, partial [Candidatus Brockarchaeota archaeon]|nr:hypothetical protein [Candidatus Brockarchaeota archaeon]
ALALFSTLLPNPLKAHASPFELGYDDGDFDYAWSNFYPSGTAVRFTPPASPWRITSVAFYGLALERGGNMLFTLEVRDQDFSLVYTSQYATFQYFQNGTFSWAKIPLPNLTVNSDFYVCIYPCFSLDATQLWIGVDEDPPISGRSLLVNREEGRIVRAWDEKSGRPRNFMIRTEGIQAVSIASIGVSSIKVGEHGIEVKLNIASSKPIVSVDGILRHGLTWDPCQIIFEGNSYVARLTEPGNLTVNVKTIDAMFGSTLKIQVEIWEAYLRLRSRVGILEESNETLTNLVQELSLRVAELNNTIVELKALNRIMEERWLNSLNQTRFLNNTLATVRSEAEALREENLWLRAGCVTLASTTIFTLLVALGLGRRLRKTQGRETGK